MKNSSPYPFALSLARAFIEDIHADAPPDEIESIQSVILCAGQFIAQTVGPGRWPHLDPAGFLRRLAASERERTGACLYLAGLYGWMATLGYVDPPAARRVVASIIECSPADPGVAAFCSHTESLLASMNN